jgi:3-(3-hydroxy-phenyl)propionate hydroxylase
MQPQEAPNKEPRPGHPFRGTGQEVQAISFAYQRSPDQDAVQPVRHPVVIVGAGPVGLSLAIDLAQRGQPVLLVDNDDKLSFGSRALCFAKRTLEIWDRLGLGQAMVDKGVSWNVGRVFLRDEQLYQFNLQPEAGHQRPAFINLQQYYCEALLVERALQLPLIDIRWKNTVVGVQPHAQGAQLMLDTPEGAYMVDAGWVVACDGSRSALRGLMGLEAKGRVFRDRFLIADVKMTADFPTERWFWFDPPFHPGQSVLLHREPDNVWRIDFQLGWDADPEEEKKPENIIPRVQALLGPKAEFSLEWASVYTFACQRMERFVHGRVIFAGDSAHGVSPFGARGANSGVQDADNLGWKLDWWLKGRSSDELLHSYAPEREYRGRRKHFELHPRHRLHHAQERDQPLVPRPGAGLGPQP